LCGARMPPYARPAMLTIPSRIEAVTVYRTGALVRRIAALEPAGADASPTIRLAGLPLTLDDSSVRVRIEGNASAELPTALDFRVALDVGEPDPAQPPAVDEDLRAAAREAERLSAAIDRVVREMGHLGGLELLPRPAPEEGKPPAPSPTAGRLALLRFASDETTRLAQELDRLRQKHHEATERHAELLERDRLATTARRSQEDELRKALVVTLDRTPTSPVQLVAEYIVSGASWTPSYVLRLGNGSRSASLLARGSVRQRTGEDWTHAQLTLSTAAAQTWTELPELTSVRIGRAQPTPGRRGFRAPPTGAEALYGDYDRAFPPPAVGARAEAEPEFDDRTPVDHITYSGAFQPQAALDVLEEQSAPPSLRSISRHGAPAPAAEAQLFASGAVDGLIASGALQRASPKRRASPTAPRAGGAPPPAQAPATVAVASAAANRADATAKVLHESVTAPATVPTDRELLRYGDLRMADPESPNRGRLVLTSRLKAYVELLVQHRVEISFDVAAVLSGAERRARAAAEGELPAGHRPPRSHQGFDFAYVADERVDIPSDGDFHTVVITEREGPARPRYVVVPRETQDCFRLLALDNPLDAPVLEGPVDVYVDDEYLLTSEIDHTPARGAIELGLGVEQAIKVSRNTSFDERAAGLMRGSLDLRHEIRIELVSHLEQAAHVEVRERVPVPRERDEDVKVEILEVTPAWQPLEQKEHPIEGGHVWNVDLPAKGRQELLVTYSVRIPAKHELAGGNRREI